MPGVTGKNHHKMDLIKLYRELVRRNVFRAVVAYLAVAWVVVQIASTILPVFQAPSYILQGLIYLLAVGLIFWTGFAWAYDLTPEGINRTPEVPDTNENRELNSHRLNAVIAVSGIIALLLMLAGSFWAGSRWDRHSDSVREPKYRVAVLPFEDRSDYAEYGYLSTGIAEEVIREVFKHPTLSVLSPQSTFRYRDSDTSIDAICKELKADILLVGSYAITGQDLEVRVEVIKGEDREVLDFSTIHGSLAQIRAITVQIGANTYKALGIADSMSELEKVLILPDVNVEAYKYNALGKSGMRDHTGQKLESILQYFQAAIDLDPTYAEPYIGMAEAFAFDVNRGYMSPTEGARRAREYALKAEKLSPGSGEVSCILGIINYLDFDLKEAIPYFERALEKSPNFILTYHWYAFVLELQGDFERAEELQKKAAVLDPLNEFNDIYLALNYMFRDESDKAELVIKGKLALDPDNKEMLWLNALCLAEKGEYEEAYQNLLKRDIGLETNFMAGYIYSRTGKKDQARKVLDKMLQRAYVSPCQLAIVYCGLGEYDKALEQMEEALLVHDIWISWAAFLSMTDPIRDDPRYVSVIKQFGLDQM